MNLAKKEAWTGEIVGLLHVNDITQSELAAEMGCSMVWLSMLLNGKRSVDGSERRMKEAIQSIINRKAET